MSVVARSTDAVQVEIEADGHHFFADEPEGAGGDTGPNPYNLLLSALGACTVMTVRMYAQRKGWPLDGVETRLEIYKVHARDCADCESEPTARVGIIEIELSLRGDLTQEQRARLSEIAGRCPVHRTLKGEIKIRTAVL